VLDHRQKYRVFAGLFKASKSLHLWINLKLSEMYKAKRLKGLQHVQSKVFEALEKFITYYNTEVDPGEYLLFTGKINDTVTFKVGAEKFTIESQINLKESQVDFKVSAWISDLSKEGWYRHEPVPDLGFYYDVDDKIKFRQFKKTITKIGDEREFHVICQFNNSEYYKSLEPFFEQFEKYTDDRLSGKLNEPKAH
jgi:hypothetical protein